jgi:Tol biopolymer transport system component
MIVLSSWQASGKADVYAAEDDGSRFRCLTSRHQLQRCQRLRISPDHRHLLFYAVPDGEEIGRFFFWEFATERLTVHEQDPYPFDIRWLTDSRLLCIRKDKLWTTTLDGLGVSGLDLGGSYLVLDVAPDGNRLLLMKKDGGRSIYVGTVDQQHVHEIVRGAEYEQSHAICYPSAWSPDGQTIACVGGAEDEVWLVDADGSDPRKVADTDYFWRKIQWSPDGKEIAFTRSLDSGGPSAERGGIFSKNLQSGEEKHILTLGWSENWQWAADGQAIIFARVRNDHYSLFRRDIRTSALTELVGETAALKDIHELIAA